MASFAGLGSVYRWNRVRVRTGAAASMSPANNEFGQVQQRMPSEGATSFCPWGGKLVVEHRTA